MVWFVSRMYVIRVIGYLGGNLLNSKKSKSSIYYLINSIEPKMFSNIIEVEYFLLSLDIKYKN